MMLPKLLLARPGAMGDICMTVPLVKLLSQHADITWLVWKQYEPLLRCLNVPCHIVAVKPNRSNKMETITSSTVAKLQSYGFDIMLDFSHWPEVADLAQKLSCIPVRGIVEDPLQDAMLGICSDGYPLYEPYNCRLPALEGAHQVHQWLELIRVVMGKSLTLCNEPAPSRSSKPRQLFLHPHSGKESKIWPVKHFVSVLKRLHSYRQISCHINSGGRPEWLRAIKLWAGLRLAGVPARIVFRDRSYRRLCRTIQQSDLALGCDSGPLHLAGILGVPSVVIYGPYPATQFAPLWGSAAVEPLHPGERAESINPDRVENCLHQVITHLDRGRSYAA